MTDSESKNCNYDVLGSDTKCTSIATCGAVAFTGASASLTNYNK